MKLVLLVFCVLVVPYLTTTAFEVVDDDNVEDEEVNLPIGAISCQIDSPERDECIRVAIQDMLPKLHKGFPNLNIPDLDPYLLINRPFEYKREPNIYALLTVKNTKFYGLTRAEIKDVRTKIDDEGMETEIDVFHPKVFAEGYYKGEGRFNALKLSAKGYFNMTMSDVSSVNKMSGKFITRNGKQYLQLEKYDMKPIIGDFHVYMTGVFPDPELNRIAVDFVNQNWPLLYRQVLPATKDTWEPTLVNELNQFLLKVPYNKMLYYGNEKEESA